jgi:hypothetical protein
MTQILALPIAIAQTGVPALELVEDRQRTPNCIPQGNLLIIQDTGTPESRPNDSANGGCMNIKFQSGVSLVDMGLLDVEEPGLNITVCVLF